MQVSTRTKQALAAAALAAAGIQAAGAAIIIGVRQAGDGRGPTGED